MSVRTGQRTLRHVAGWLIAGSVLSGLFAIAVRAGWGGLAARVLEGTTLFLAAFAYLAHVVAHHEHARELVTKSILVSAFALWGIVQIAPTLPNAATVNDVVIVLFVVDLAIIVTPWL